MSGKLLIVDDTEGQRIDLIEAASNAGFTKEQMLIREDVAGARDAIANETDIAVAIVDLQLPGGELHWAGLELIRELTRLDHECKIIGYTTRAPNEVVQMARVYGAEHCVVNPKGEDAPLEKLTRILSGYRAEPQPQT